jgi:hypothetical protein
MAARKSAAMRWYGWSDSSALEGADIGLAGSTMICAGSSGIRVASELAAR